jgi:ankyrin repeat protein
VSLALPLGALLKAAGDGDAAVVARLLAAGADVDVADSAGRTALYLASKHGHLAVVEELLEAEAHRRRSKKAIIDHKKKYHWL